MGRQVCEADNVRKENAGKKMKDYLQNLQRIMDDVQLNYKRNTHAMLLINEIFYKNWVLMSFCNVILLKP